MTDHLEEVLRAEIDELRFDVERWADQAHDASVEADKLVREVAGLSANALAGVQNQIDVLVRAISALVAEPGSPHSGASAVREILAEQL